LISFPQLVTLLENLLFPRVQDHLINRLISLATDLIKRLISFLS
jgi:hypothetical protein